MSDEIKNTETDAPKAQPTEEALPEAALEQVTGGGTASAKLYEAVATGKHIPKVVIELL